MQRKKSLYLLANRKFDILVIGGGISGACIAHDAALRGFSVALIDRRDFGGFTSSASSKLLHGGIRYLPKGQLWKVRESGREQMIFQQLAPHLVRWQPFLIPTEKGAWMKGSPALKTAMKLYNFCHIGLDSLLDDASRKPPRGEFFNTAEATAQAPQLGSIAGFSGAQVLFESHMHSSERMTLAFLKTAVSNEAVVANYLEAQSYIAGQGGVRGVRVRDPLTDEEFIIAARLTVNSVGPAAQALNRSVSSLRLRLKKKLTGFARGVHIVTQQIHPQYALALTTRKKTEGLVTRGGRHFFIIPWRGRSLIGTTNVPFKDDFDRVRVTERDVEDFLTDINDTLPELHLRREHVHYAFTGLYPLVRRSIQADKYQGTGEYQLVDHQRADGIAGIITALGAKYTTARKLAENTVNLAAKKFDQRRWPCRTASTPLLEGSIRNLHGFIARKQKQYRALLPADGVRHLIRYHGTGIDRVMETAAGEADLLRPLSPATDTFAAEVLYAVRKEMAMTLEDVIFRRTGTGTVGRPDERTLNRAADIMAAELGWNGQRVQEEKSRVLARYDFGHDKSA